MECEFTGVSGILRGSEGYLEGFWSVSEGLIKSEVFQDYIRAFGMFKGLSENFRRFSGAFKGN